VLCSPDVPLVQSFEAFSTVSQHTLKLLIMHGSP
jgi:hypothetical protein